MSRFFLTLSLACLVGAVAHGQNLQTVRTITPDGAPLLAEGPFPVTVSWFNSITKARGTEKGTLLFLTEKTLYYRTGPQNEIKILPASPEFITAESLHAEFAKPGGGKDRPLWKRDDTKNTYTGPIRPLRDAALPARPAALAPNELGYYLYYALERLQIRADDALLDRDLRLVKQYTERSTEVEQYMKEQKLDRVIAGGYASLPTYMKSQLDASQEIDNTIAEAFSKNKELAQKARTAAARQQTAAMIGLFQGLTSAIPDVEEWEGSNGVRYRRETYDVGGVISGLGTIAQANARYASEMNRLSAAREALNAATAERVKNLETKIRTNRANRIKELRMIGVDRFGLPPTSPADQLGDAQLQAAKTKNLELVTDLLAARVKRDKGDGPRDNPFAILDLCFAQADAVDRADPEVGEKVFVIAERAARATRLIPEGALFDFDRVDAIRMASSLACSAALAETTRGIWARAYSPRAAYAVRLLDDAGSLARLDVTGEAREQRAVALMLAGRTDEAVKQAEQVAELRKGSRTFQYNLARMYSVRSTSQINPRKDTGLALDALEVALRLGFCNIPEIRGGFDFYPLTVAKDDKTRFDALTRVDVAYVFDPKTGTVVLRNKSKFPVTGARVSLNLTVVGGDRKQRAVVDKMKEPFPPLRPGAMVPWENAVNLMGDKLVRGVVMLESDQGKVPNVPVGSLTP